ncbi:hypothetical protein RHOSPDRAFT_30833 [Rhodotorula sp. JG-1b]|nr:hypothetical protein RHOSPDRAFT_30833 [Rhodotorula sp. JG-1b]
MASTEQKASQQESAVEAISKGHGLGVYSLEFQNHVESESKNIIANTPGFKPKKLAKKVEKAWDQKHPLSDDAADEASPASAAKVAATTTTAATPPSAPAPATPSATDKPIPGPKHHKKKPAGTATSNLQKSSNGAGDKRGGVKAQGYMEEIVVAKITEITSSEEDEST